MRTLVENEIYALHVSRIADIERCDEALTGVTWAISHMAEEFAVVPGFETLRMAKTEKLRKGDGFVRLRVWFAIRDRYTVELLSVDFVTLTSALVD